MFAATTERMMKAKCFIYYNNTSRQTWIGVCVCVWNITYMCVFMGKHEVYVSPGCAATLQLCFVTQIIPVVIAATAAN